MTKSKLRAVEEAEVVDETTQEQQPKPENSPHILVIEDWLKNLDRDQKSLAVLRMENDNLRLQNKMQDTMIMEFRKDDNHVSAAAFALDYIIQWMAAEYGITIQGGRLVYVETGNELPKSND